MSAAGTPRAVARTILTVAWALLGVYLLQLATSAGGDDVSSLLGRWGYDLILLAACGVAAWGALRQAPPRRAAWLLVAGSLGLWSGGQVLYSILWYFADSPPNPSAADVLFLAFYGPAYAGLVLLLRARVRGVERIAWLDGLIAGLAIAAIVAAAAVPAVADAIGASALASAVAIAYPVCDLILLGTVGAMVALTGGQIDRPTGLVGLGLVLFAVQIDHHRPAHGQAHHRAAAQHQIGQFDRPQQRSLQRGRRTDHGRRRSVRGARRIQGDPSI